MRRMTTTKQLNYIKDLSEVAEKGFKVGTYPHEITGYAGYCDLDYSIEQMIENEEIDFENHEVSTGDLYFYYPNLLKYYGLGESGDEGSVLLILDDGFSFPETINNAESLKKWMLSEDFVNLIPSAGGYIEECILSNEVAVYSPKNYWQVSLENNQLLINETFVCDQGEGEKIVGATDPIGEPTLEVKNLQSENLQVENLEITGKQIIIAPNNTVQTWSEIKRATEDQEYRYFDLTEGSFIKIVLNKWDDKDINLKPALGMAPVFAKIYFYNNSGILIHNYSLQPIDGNSTFYKTDGSDVGGTTYAIFGNYSGDNENTTYLEIKILDAIQSQDIDITRCDGRMEIELYMGPGFQNTKYL